VRVREERSEKREERREKREVRVNESKASERVRVRVRMSERVRVIELAQKQYKCQRRKTDTARNK